MPEMKVSVMSHRSSERPHRMTFRRVADLWCWNEMLLQTRPALDLLDQGLWFNVETAFGVTTPACKLSIYHRHLAHATRSSDRAQIWAGASPRGLVRVVGAQERFHAYLALFIAILLQVLIQVKQIG